MEHISRAQRSMKWCAAEPGSLQMLSLRRSRMRCNISRCIASGKRDGSHKLARNAQRRRPHVGRRYAIATAEHAVEIGQVVKAARVSNGCDPRVALPRVAQQNGGAFEALGQK